MTMRRFVVRVPERVLEGLDAARKPKGISRAAEVRSALASYGGTEPGPADASTSAAKPAPKPAKTPAPPVRARVLAEMEARPDEVFTAPALAGALDAKGQSVRNALVELARKGKIERVAVGQYRARGKKGGRR
jgi:hypothetical protein